MIVNAPSKFNLGLSEVHLCKLPIEQGKLVDHLSEQERESFYMELKCMGLWH